MNRIEDLEKAIIETAQAGVELLKKSQMSLFGPGTTNLTPKEILATRKEGLFTKEESRQMHGEAHHIGYTRVSASGTSSTIAAKNPHDKTIQDRPTHHGAASEEAENYSKRAWISDDTKDGHDAAEAALTHSAKLHSAAAEEADAFGDSRTAQWHDRKAILHRQMAEEHGAESHRMWQNEQQAKQVETANEKLADEKATDTAAQDKTFHEGEDVKAHEAYGGKRGRVVSSTDSGYVTVDHGDGTQAIYHNSDLDHHDGWNEDEDD